jgi:hypothetical protein
MLAGKKKQEHLNRIYSMVESDYTLMVCDLLTAWGMRGMGPMAWADEYACGIVIMSFLKT